MTAQRTTAVVLLAVVLAACHNPADSVEKEEAVDSGVIRVAGEVHSSDSSSFGAPSIRNIWQYTIAYMAPDGARVRQGEAVLRFDTQELQANIVNQRNQLNEKQKELGKQEILARQRVADLRLMIEEARADRDKAALKANIPETLLAARDYRENQLLLEQARMVLAQKQAELELETVVLETEIDILQREISVLETDIRKLEESIAAMTITAPQDGVVIHVVDQQGNKLAVGDNVWGGRRVVAFPDLAKLELRVEIPERDAARVSIGQPVSFTLDAVPDRELHGEIAELASVVHTRSVSQPAKVFDATVALHEPNVELMRPGMSVTAQVQLDTAEEQAR